MANRSKSPKPPIIKQEAASENTSQVRLEELARTSTELARIVAKNFSAAPKLLQELGSSSDDTTRKGVASNPNTPTDVLLKLGAQFPGELLENPVFPLLFLENPNLLADMPLATLRSLLKRDAVPESFLEWAAGSTDTPVLLAVAMNPNTPKTALSKLIQNLKADVAEAAKLHVNWAGEMSEGWEQAALAAMKIARLPRDRQTETYLWAIGAIPEFLVPTLDREVQLSIAQNPNTPAHILEMLAGDSDRHRKIRVALARNPNTPVSLLDIRQAAIANLNQNFAQNFNARESILNQWLSVQNPQTPQETIAQLATSKSLLIRECIALHPNASTTVLEQLAKDKSSAIRSSVAQNPHTPRNLLEQLAQDNNQEVAIAVAQNPNTPISILEKFAKRRNRNSQIKQAAVKSLFSQYPDKVFPFLLEYIKSFQPSFTRLLFFLNPLAPSSFLAKNFDSSSWLERYAIAQNPNTPAAIRQRLAQDGNRIVRAAATNLQHYVSD